VGSLYEKIQEEIVSFLQKDKETTEDEICIVMNPATYLKLISQEGKAIKHCLPDILISSSLFGLGEFGVFYKNKEEE